MSLQEKLINALYKAATSSRKIRVIFTPIGLVFFFTLVTLFVVASLWVDKLAGYSKIIPVSRNIIISVLPLTIGLFLILWSIFHFIKAKGTPVPINPPPKLVTTGPYAHLRNPMITGMFILLFGLGILFNSASLVFIFTPLFILLNVLELKTIEEPELEKRLGEKYLEYKKKVPMFIPRLKKKI
jgi:protein-S-isoprenylcysteine O-methyltransferase Ste14